MTGDRTHLSDVQRQFRRQGQPYARREDVADERALQALVMLSGVGSAERVVDVACGPGFLTIAFARHCGRAVGVDATDTFVTMARQHALQRGVDNVRFLLADVTQLPFPEGAFDVAVCRAAFHHFPDPARVLGEMRRVTTAAGRVVVADMVSSEDAAKAAYHNRIERLCDPTHVRALSESELDALFGAAQLTVAYKGRSTLHYELAEWMSHGGPSAEAARQITELMQASIETDRTGLNVRSENGQIHFSHTGVGFLLAKDPNGGNRS